jgi:hypothetical protein
MRAGGRQLGALRPAGHPCLKGDCRTESVPKTSVSGHPFLERSNSAVVGFLSCRFRKGFRNRSYVILLRRSWLAKDIKSITSRGPANCTSRWADGLRQIENAPANISRIEVRRSAAFMRVPWGQRPCSSGRRAFAIETCILFPDADLYLLKRRKTAVSTHLPRH